MFHLFLSNSFLDMCGAARELAVALATKGFTDWSCPPEAKQRTFLPPVDDGLDEMIGKLVMRQDRQQDGEGEASQGVVDRAGAVTTGEDDHEQAVVPLAERAAKQWKDFAVALLVLLIMRHFLRRRVQRREVAGAPMQQQGEQRGSQQEDLQHRQQGHPGPKPTRQLGRHRSGATREAVLSTVDRTGRSQRECSVLGNGEVGDGGTAGDSSRLSSCQWLLGRIARGPTTDGTVASTVSVSAAEIEALRAKAARLDATSVEGRCVCQFRSLKDTIPPKFERQVRVAGRPTGGLALYVLKTMQYFPQVRINRVKRTMEKHTRGHNGWCRKPRESCRADTRSAKDAWRRSLRKRCQHTRQPAEALGKERRSIKT